MNERYLSRAKRMDNGEWETGYYLGCEHKGVQMVYLSCNFTDKNAHEIEYDYIRVDPATVEPVRAPVKREITLVGDYRCPRCNAAFIEGMDVTPFCGHCGQALDWSGTPEEGQK